MKLLAFLGAETGLLISVLIVMFCWKKKVGQRLALIVVAVNMWLPMIKSIVLRPRPYMEFPDRLKPLVLDQEGAAMDVAAQGYSFPSMHSASIPALYFPLANEAKKKWLWIIAVVLTLSVGISRIVVGMHYPTDVLAGVIYYYG
ncbi:phosphatase PAP2 family protein [Oribacterium sp. C9]|uniref:phosphatase PAP2 family protein n=1 Tax=Oribacterium sp. C9 TaxID=1943579 RepID=UPI00143C3925|nr:phosphatase PAP2 family protein [Oribacterium sp. C9]